MFEKLAGTWELSVGDTLIPAKLLGNISARFPEKYSIVRTQAGIERIPLQSCLKRDCELDFSLVLPRNSVMKCLNTLWSSISADSTFIGIWTISSITTYKIRALDSATQCSVDSCYTQIKLNNLDSTSDIVCLDVHIKGIMRG